MNVWITIKSERRTGDDQESIELSTAGQMEHTGEGTRLIYQESEATGMAGVTTTLRIQPGMVTMQREGTMNSLMILEKGRRTQCSYDTGYGCLDMSVYTRHLTADLDEHGGNIHFHYALTINNQHASSHDVHVTVRDAAAPAENERRRSGH